MKRIPITPRKNLDSKLTEIGFLYHKDYYTETAAYEFTAAEVDKIDVATAAIFDMCCQALNHVIKNNLFATFFIPEQYAALIKTSWEEDFCSFYGRMDLAVSADCSQIKLLEFNADTPTSLLEAAVVQWYWLQEYNQHYDQFNSIHERLIAHLKICRPYLTGDGKLWFSAMRGSHEDVMTVSYLRDLAKQAGLPTEFVAMHDIGVNEAGRFSAVQNGKPEFIDNIFKLYPYEWMFNEAFGKHLDMQTTWIEPYYKAIMSNKMLLIILHQLFPDSPYILPTYYGSSNGMTAYAKKPVYSREGNNVTLVENGNILQETGGSYGQEGYIYQQYQELHLFDGNRPVIGSWLIGGNTAGMGIKETSNYIHDNMSQFCPHYFK